MPELNLDHHDLAAACLALTFVLTPGIQEVFHLFLMGAGGVDITPGELVDHLAKLDDAFAVQQQADGCHSPGMCRRARPEQGPFSAN